MHLDPAIGAQPSPAFIGFFAALANARATGEARLAEAEITLAEGEAAIDRGIEAVARMVANDRAAAESGSRLDWDYRIERLEFYEDRGSARRSPNAQAGRPHPGGRCATPIRRSAGERGG